MKTPKSDPLSGEEYITTGVLSRLCRVSPRTVAKWTDKLGLPHFRVPGKGRCRRIRRQDAVEFLKKHGVPVPPELLDDHHVLVSDDAALIVRWRGQQQGLHAVAGSLTDGVRLLCSRPVVRVVFDTYTVSTWELLRERPSILAAWPRLTLAVVLPEDALPEDAIPLSQAGFEVLPRHPSEVACA